MKNQLAIACVLSLTLATPVLAAGQSEKQKETPGKLDPKPAGLLPGMHGEGIGTWRAPTKTAGRLRATSTVDPKGPTFGFDAALTRIFEKGSTEVRGDLHGEMILIDHREGSRVVALVAGEWSHDADGKGAFVAHILLPTGDRDEPFTAVGRCFGPFQVPSPDLKDDPKGPRGAPKGSVTFRWDVSP